MTIYESFKICFSRIWVLWLVFLSKFCYLDRDPNFRNIPQLELAAHCRLRIQLLDKPHQYNQLTITTTCNNTIPITVLCKETFLKVFFWISLNIFKSTCQITLIFYWKTLRSLESVLDTHHIHFGCVFISLQALKVKSFPQKSEVSTALRHTVLFKVFNVFFKLLYVENTTQMYVEGYLKHFPDFVASCNKKTEWYNT